MVAKSRESTVGVVVVVSEYKQYAGWTTLGQNFYPFYGSCKFHGLSSRK